MTNCWAEQPRSATPSPPTHTPPEVDQQLVACLLPPATARWGGRYSRQQVNHGSAVVIDPVVDIDKRTVQLV